VILRTRFLILSGLAVFSMLTIVPAQVEAQRRAVQRPSSRRVVLVSSRFYRPFYYGRFYHPGFYYSAFYSPFYFSPFDYSPYWGWHGQYRYPPYGWRRYYDNTGSARLQVTPRNAEVFLDGYFVGTVDDFDGYLQRLHAPAGEHELTVHLEGYKSYREKVLLRPGATLKITHVLQPLGPGEASEPRPAPDPNARVQSDPNRRPARPYQRGEESNFGTLSLRVQPDDAVVLIDGEEWDRPAGEDRLTIDLAEGTHRLEVRKDGFRSYMRTVDIRRGQTVTLNVSLATGRVLARAITEKLR
jgi:hypothetical protein